MAEMYHVVVPEGGLQGVRLAAAGLDPDDVRAAGLDGARAYFAGHALILRLEGEGDVLEKLARSRTGKRLLDALDEQAWFRDQGVHLDPLRAPEDGT